MLSPVLKCLECGKTFDLDSLSHSCTACGEPLIIEYDYENLKEVFSLANLRGRGEGVWKYREALPFEEVAPISLGEGGTYLSRCKRLEKLIGVRALYVKNESTNPTGSFIDRGATILVTKAKEEGHSRVISASAGNLGSSLAAYAAKAGFRCHIYISPTIDLGKLYQMIAFGAEVKPGKTTEEAMMMLQRHGGYGYTVSLNNPYPLEGEKTIAYEITEQLESHLDRIIVPMGSGGLITAIWKGITELESLGHIDERPMMTGVQENTCAPIVEAYKGSGRKLEALKETPLAIDICVPQPTYLKAALRSIYHSKGAATSISDKEIVEAASLLSVNEGIFAEPAAASTIAGLKKLIDEGVIERSETVICVITGEGLKDPLIARRLIEKKKALDKVIMRTEGKATKFGETKITILNMLKGRDLHGYGIWNELRKRFEIRITSSGVYQHLNEMEAMGMVKRCKVESVRGKPERFYYTLTEKGRKTSSGLT